VQLKGRKWRSDDEEMTLVIRLRRQRRRQATELARLLVALDAAASDRRFAPPRAPKRLSLGTYR
jgi:hypothetical protein